MSDALTATHAGVWVAAPDAASQAISRADAIRRVADTPHIIVNAPMVASRLGLGELAALDLLELFAFIHPARFAVPTPRGLAAALGIDPPRRDDDAGFGHRAAAALIDTADDPEWPARHGAWGVLQALARQRWPWAPHLQRRIRKPEPAERSLFTNLPKWEETPQRTPPRNITLPTAAVLARLDTLLGGGAEARTGQRDYADAVTAAFQPRRTAGAPNMVLAEAGTGIGKTLGYIAPAVAWAQAADGAVWLSTYTKALQRQLDQESTRAYPDRAEKRHKVVVRKGRENYLCLLNLEDAVQGGFANRAQVFAQLAARWAQYSRDGDMVGGDLPGWLPALFGRSSFSGLTDRRGECIHAACPHYRICFIERAARASAAADLVIANHALVMVNAVRGRAEGVGMTRLVFDEGHHLFDAADATFAVELTGREAVELRHWLLGPDRTNGARSSGRRRGLSARLAELAGYDDEGAAAIDAVVAAARLLPAEGWLARIIGGTPEGALETLLGAVRLQVLARTDDRSADAGYGLETEIAAVLPAVIEAAAAAATALARLTTPMAALEARLAAMLDDPPDWLDGGGRARVEGAAAGLRLRTAMLAAWTALLARLGGAADANFVDWFAMARADGREIDIGIHRRWLDPMRPFAKAVLEPAHGVVVTSATLRSRTVENNGWEIADARSGARHLIQPPTHFAVASPFDYAGNARVLIVTDIRRGDLAGLAHAYRSLIEAAAGGTLGLFTAIARLRSVHARINDPLARAGLPLYAQHVDPIDTGTLVDIFRAEPHASLLGTDALRDGVDVPGASLRQVVMEGVPWPRPTVLHAARRAGHGEANGGGTAYDDQVVMGRLAQAFGRLIRRADDRGTFVLIGAAVPSRLLAAFPPGTPVDRVRLDDAVAVVAAARHGGETLPVGEIA